jgi:hypothetical protein
MHEHANAVHCFDSSNCFWMSLDAVTVRLFVLQALYSNEELGHILPKRCDPTIKPCEPFLQISAYSYVAGDREERHTQLLHRLKEHVEKMPQSFIVFEDFDRFDCSLRDFIRDVRSLHPQLNLLCSCPRPFHSSNRILCSADDRVWPCTWAAMDSVHHRAHIQRRGVKGCSDCNRKSTGVVPHTLFISNPSRPFLAYHTP